MLLVQHITDDLYITDFTPRCPTESEYFSHFNVVKIRFQFKDDFYTMKMNISNKGLVTFRCSDEEGNLDANSNYIYLIQRLNANTAKIKNAVIDRWNRVNSKEHICTPLNEINL